MRLVGVAGVERGAGEVGVARGQEAPEAQHALERLRAVAGGGVAAAAQLALAEAEVAGERLDPRLRLLEPPRGLGDRGVGGRRGHRDLRDPAQRLARLEVRRQPLRERAVEVGQVDAQVAQLGERQAERGAARAGAEARADEDRVGPRGHRHRAGVGPGHERPAAGLPDQVGAGVGQDRRASCAPVRIQRQARGGAENSRYTHPIVPRARVRSVQDGAGWIGGMPDLDLAEQFLAAQGRILDRRRFERLFRGGDAAPVRDAVAAYRNADGGFGHGLEPDGRTPGTQPAATEQALRILDQADAWDEELARGACDQLQAAAPPEGGAIFVHDNVEGWPHAPWWQPARRASR